MLLNLVHSIIGMQFVTARQQAFVIDWMSGSHGNLLSPQGQTAY